MKQLTFPTASGRPPEKRPFSRLGAALMAAGLMLPFGCAKKAEVESHRTAEIRVIFLSKHLGSLIEDMKSGRPRYCGKQAYERHREWREDHGAGAVSYHLLAQATDIAVEKGRHANSITYDIQTFGTNIRAFMAFSGSKSGFTAPYALAYLTPNGTGYHLVPGTCYLEPNLDTQFIKLDTLNAILGRATGERANGAMWLLDHDARGDCGKVAAFAILLSDSAAGPKPWVATGRGDSIPPQVIGRYRNGYLACGSGAGGPRWDAVLFLVEPGDTFPDLSGLGVDVVSFH